MRAGALAPWRGAAAACARGGGGETEAVPAAAPDVRRPAASCICRDLGAECGAECGAGALPKRINRRLPRPPSLGRDGRFLLLAMGMGAACAAIGAATIWSIVAGSP